MVLQSILVALKSSMNLDSMHESVPVIKFTIKIHTITTIHYFIIHIKQRKKKTNKKSVSLIQNWYINRVQKQRSHHTVTFKGLGRKKRSRKRKLISPEDRGVVGYIRTLNKLLLLHVPLFSLCFLSPEVHNYSNHILSPSERYLLSLSLKLRPTTRVLSLNVLNQQLDDFVKSVRIKYFFRDYVSVHTQQSRKLFIKSDWIPPLGPSWIEIPLSAIN